MAHRHLAGISAVLLLSLSGAIALAAPPRLLPGAKQPVQRERAGKPAASPEWQAVDQLVADQKLEEASAKIEKILTGARQRGDQADWTQALIRWVELRSALHGPETAIRFLRDQPWPSGALYRTILELHFAGALVNYARGYSWEIAQRERVASSDKVDLKAWTRDQIYEAAGQSFGRIWAQREALGKEPVSRLERWIVPNDYPAGIRPTLRDAATYLFASMLADTGGWRPEQSFEVYRLDLDGLVAGDAARSKAVVVDDATIHPLIRVGALLDDLESWHVSLGQREAALEARLERSRILFAAFTQPADKGRVIDHLTRRLARERELPWWSMGMAQLAEMVIEEGEKNGWVRARQIAREGAAVRTDSPGAKRCEGIALQIERPAFELHTMRVDGPKRRSIQVSHRNLRTLHFRAYAETVDARIGERQEFSLLPSVGRMAELVRTAKPVAEWSVELPPTPDYSSHLTYVTPPLDQPGLYVIAASPDPKFQDKHQPVLGVRITISDLVALIRSQRTDGLELQILSGRSGEAVAGAEVDLYQTDWQRGHKKVDTRKADASGLVHFKRADIASYFAVAHHGKDSVLAAGYLSDAPRMAPVKERDALIYTDRAIYRPLQKVYFKIVAYQGNRESARLQVDPKIPVKVMLQDANSKVVSTQTLQTNAFGSAAGEFLLPAGRLLGNWSIATDHGGGARFRVEEYKRPTFEVAIQDPKEPLRINRQATLRGEVRYYFGLPVTNGQVRWRVTREPIFPLWWGWWNPMPAQAPQVVASGASPLRDDGSFELTFKPEADERVRTGAEVTFRYRAAVDVTDEGGETRSTDRAFRLGLVVVEARFDAEKEFGREGVGSELTVVRTDLDGIPRPGAGSWRLVALEQPKEALLPADQPPPPSGASEKKGSEGDHYQTPGDRLLPRWNNVYKVEPLLRSWKDGRMISKGSLKHGEKGEAKLALPPLEPGAYRVIYETQDDHGATYRTQKEWVVAGRSLPLRLPAYLQVETSTVRVGGTARLLVHSGIPGQALFLERIRGGRRVSLQVLHAGKDGALIELPVTEEDRGGFAWELVVERDHQLMRMDAKVAVPWDDRALEVELSSFRDRLRPGAKETWRVTVKGPPGAKPEVAATELLAYMYDRSLDALAPHSPPSPMELWPDRTSLSKAQTNLGAEGSMMVGGGYPEVTQLPRFEPDRLYREGGYGIGGPGRRFKGVPGLGGRGMPPPAPAAMAAKPEARVAARMADQEVETAALGVQPGKPAAEATPLRSNFAETAFWRPQILANRDGSASIEFTVPDSVTSWAVFVHAVTRDLWSGSTRRQAESVKDLMVRPYLPRFLREGDTAELKVVLNDSTDRPLSGQVKLEIFDPDTQRDLAADFGLTPADRVKSFSVGRQSSANVSFKLTAPRRVLTAAFKVVARAEELSDGELRPLPVLPGRIHLAQSRFAALRDRDQRTLSFTDLAQPDPTRMNERLVVTVDAQLLYSVLSALPYLVNYPYECTEQTLNRFLSTAIVGTVFRDHPAIARMARELSKRETPLERFDGADPNRKMTLEESPWLLEAQGGVVDPKSQGVLAKILDPQVAAAQRDQALAKLKQAQTASGGFPWFPGGPPSPYMTLYLLHGFAKAAEFQVAVPKEMVTRAWGYLAEYVRTEELARMRSRDSGWELMTFLNYVASAFPDSSWTANGLSEGERREILDFTYRHWKEHSPFLKGYLALTLKRAGRLADAQRVWASVMDSAKTAPDQGTFWAAEERSWLWYNDTIETHAFALRTLMELDPANAKKDGLVLWLLLNKKLSQWKSTRATAEVIYSLIHYMKKEKQLGQREAVEVTAGGETKRFVFEPDSYTGKGNQLVIPGERVNAQTAKVTVKKETPGLAFASATWHFSTEKMPAEARGDFFSVTRRYFLRERKGKEAVLRSLAEGAPVKVGDEVEVQLSLHSKHPAEYVHLRDPRGAGFEPDGAVSQYHYDLGIVWYQEFRDSGTNFFFEWLPQGEYTFKYRIRASMAGTFRVGPATVQSLYAPEFNAYSTGAALKVEPSSL